MKTDLLTNKLQKVVRKIAISCAEIIWSFTPPAGQSLFKVIRRPTRLFTLIFQVDTEALVCRILLLRCQ